MEASKEETFLNASDSKIGERFFGTPERPKVKSGQTSSIVKMSTKPSLDVPDPADSYTSYKLNEPVRLQMSDEGALAQKPLTVMTALQMTADRFNDNDAFAVNVDGKWQKTKLRDMCRMVRTVAKGFLYLGLQKFHGVGIMGHNAPEWIVSCLATIYAGGVAVGIHSNHTIEDCTRVAQMVQCNIIVVDSAEDLAKVFQIRSSLPDLLAIVQYGKERSKKTQGVVSWDHLLAMGDHAAEDKLKERILSVAPNYCCIVTFTMGRTGPPKAVMLSHDNVIWSARVFGKYQSFSSSGGAHVSFHSLCRPLGQLLDIFIPLIYATTVYFVPRELLKHKLVDFMRDAHPTFFMTIPLFYEKIADQLQMSIDNSVLTKMMTKMAMNIGRKAFRNEQEGKPRPFGWWLANRLVFKRVQRRLGLDRCIEVHSAGNSIPPRTTEFFIGLNMVILNDYGTSEFGPHTVSLPYRNRFGSCGVEMDGCHTKFVPIDKTVFTEVRVKGRHVFMGYLNEPQMTADAFDEDGWNKTTDLGYRDESGFIWFLGSIYELYELSDGRVISPIPIEEAVKNLLPFLGHCIACGHNRPYLVMLFTLDALADDKTDIPLDVLSKKAEMWLRKMNVEVSAISQMAANPPGKLVDIVQSAINQFNERAQPSTTVIQRWKFLPRDFSIPAGELTLTHRERRKFILDNYASTIDALYE